MSDWNGRVNPELSYPDPGLGTADERWPETHTDSLHNVIATNDSLGSGTNVCPEGGSYKWHHLSTGKVYDVTRVNDKYFAVELGEAS